MAGSYNSGFGWSPGHDWGYDWMYTPQTLQPNVSVTNPYGEWKGANRFGGPLAVGERAFASRDAYFEQLGFQALEGDDHHDVVAKLAELAGQPPAPAGSQIAGLFSIADELRDEVKGGDSNNNAAQIIKNALTPALTSKQTNGLSGTELVRLTSSRNDVVGDELVLDARDAVSKKAIPEMTVPRVHGLLPCRLMLRWKTVDPTVTASTATRWMQRNLSVKHFRHENHNRRRQCVLRRRN